MANAHTPRDRTPYRRVFEQRELNDEFAFETDPELKAKLELKLDLLPRAFPGAKLLRRAALKRLTKRI